MENNHIQLEFTLPDKLSGVRLDLAVSECLKDYSRSKIQQWIEAGALTLNGQVVSPKIKVKRGDRVAVDVTLQEAGDWQAQNIPIQVVYEDNDIIIIDKPINLVVHPGAGVPDGTLVNALLYHYPELQTLPRAGIVHRLDKDTSGLMVVARTLEAHTHLVEAMQARQIERIYQAIVQGEVKQAGEVNAPIGRDPRNRLKMAVVESGKPAVTHYRVLQSYQGATHLECRLETGRTHQIRVHLTHIGHPIIGDQTYGQALQGKAVISRQALHAVQLSLTHPVSAQHLTFNSELPQDILDLCTQLTKR